MTTIAPRPRTTPAATRRIALSCPLWVAVVCSRLIVLAAGAAGALFTHRGSGWQMYDPSQISSSMGSVGNVLAASSVRGDAIGYLTIAQHGYESAGSTRLFPLYPLLIRAVGMIVGSPVIAGVLISLVTFTIGLTLVHRIASEEIGRRTADTTVLLMACSPLSFVFSAVYTESLLLACVAGAFYLARRGRFVLACIAATGATLTHVDGVFMVAPLAFIYWQSRGRTPRRVWSPSVLALAMPPLALAGFFAYIQMHGSGWLAPIANQNMTYAARTLVGPPIVLFESLQDVAIGLHHQFQSATAAGGAYVPALQNVIYLIAFIIAILGLVNAWRLLPKEYVLFAALAIVICSSSAVATEPLKGFDRYMLPIFPLWIGAGAWLERRRWIPAFLTISTVMLIFYTVEFSRWISVF